jgi:gluconolactonase
MARHRDGGLVVSGRDVSLVAGGESRPLYVPDAASGITGINDLTVDTDGNVVVGHLRFRPFAGESPVPGEFVSVGPDGRTTEVVGGVLWTNGCAFSPDGSVFYGCDYHRGVVLAAERRGDGSYGPGRVAVTSPSGEADGMAVDETGALWVALGARASVGRFTPDGELDTEVEVPTGFVASLCFGGADGRDLFITTAARGETPGAVFTTRAPVAGAELFLSAG